MVREGKLTLPQKRARIKQDRRIDSRLGGLLLGGLALWVLVGLLWHPFIVGTHPYHTYFIVIFPTLTGLTVYILYRLAYIKRLISSAPPIWKFIYAVLYVLMGLFTGYFTLGFAADTTWKYLHQRVAATSPVETHICPVIYISKGRNYGIGFTFRGKNDYVTTQYSVVKNLNSSLIKYELKLLVQRGIWDYYTVRHWEIREVPSAGGTKQATQ